MHPGLTKRAMILSAYALLWTCVASAQTPASLSIPSVDAPSLDPKADVSAWKNAATVTLPWDVQHQAKATEQTTARIGTDGKFIYVRFDVTQREALLAQQHTNNVGDGTDDEVWIDLWPDGNSGFYYQFAATSNGTHFQYSSENSAYEPTWESYGTAYAGGFTVTMKIPLAIMRGVGHGGWKAQFVRVVRSTGERQVWSYDRAQIGADDVRYAGVLTGMKAVAAARPQPRVGLYTLGQVGSRASGLSTSRVGADVSIPITSTASFVATLHPDFSNVEVDQQTISPTAFQRFFNEVRPFFTQLNNNFNNFDCDVCPGINELYTPGIPTPRDGYALEGKQGPMSFGAFDALGVGRTDAAQSIGYQTPDNHWRFSAQRVAADRASVHDDIDTTGFSFNDGKHVDAYFNYGSDSGSNVLLGNQAQRYDGGGFVATNTFGFGVSARKIGLYYNPVDGLVQHPDIAGYGTYAAKIWLFDDKSKMNSAGISGFIDRYHNMSGALDQTDSAITLDALTKSRIDVQVFLGSSYLLQNFACSAATCVFTPISQNGVSLTWHSGTVNNPGNFPNHAGSSTPTNISYNTGRFGPGRLDSWFRSTTMRAGTRGTISLELDSTRQALDSGGANIQWLERLGYTYATGPDSSLAVGVRRIVGTAPEVFAAAPSTCTTVGNPVVNAQGVVVFQPCTGAWNLSFAYHHRTPHDELFFAYGDASQLSTVPGYIVKLIHYFGAEKGT